MPRVGDAVWDSLWGAFLNCRVGFEQPPGARQQVLYVSANGAKQGPMSLESLPAKAEGHIRFLLVSDTHERHHGLTLPPADVLVHSGDILASSRFASQTHSERKLRDLNTWLASTQCACRVVVAGNHDVALKRMGAARVAQLLSAATYLEFETATLNVQMSEGKGQDHTVALLVYGAPYSAGRSHNSAFQDEVSEKRLLESAPMNADVVVTHGPAEGGKKPVGPVPELLRRLQPRLHCCGHEHGLSGTVVPLQDKVGNTGFSINAAIMAKASGVCGVKNVGGLSVAKLFGQRPTRPPIVFDMPCPETVQNSTSASCA